MKRVYLVAVPLVVLSLAPASAFGQSLLEKLEEKLRGPAKTTEPAEPATPGEAAAGEPAGGAVPAGDSELPAPAPRSDNAPVKHGFLGIRGVDSVGGGVKVIRVNPGSPGEAGGIRSGDVIKKINLTEIANMDDMERMLDGAPGGAKFKVSVIRDGGVELLDVTLGRPFIELEGDEPTGPGLTARTSADEPESAAPAVAAQRASLGITVVPLTDEMRARYGITTRSGAVIAAVRPGGPAALAGLPVGAVVVAMDGQRIDNQDQLVGAIRAAKPGDEVELSYYVGPKLSRQSIRLAAAEAGIAAPGSGYGGLGDRPALDRVERALGGLARPGARTVEPSGDLPGARDDLESLREQIDQLAKRVEALEQLAAKLEARLPVENPPAADDPALPPAGERPRIRIDDEPAIPPASPPAAEKPPVLPPPTRPPAKGKSNET